MSETASLITTGLAMDSLSAAVETGHVDDWFIHVGNVSEQAYWLHSKKWWDSRSVSLASHMDSLLSMADIYVIATTVLKDPHEYKCFRDFRGYIEEENEGLFKFSDGSQYCRGFRWVYTFYNE